MDNKGFVMLNRKFFSHELWKEARTFSECEAWLDLIQSARFEATDKTECIGGRKITYGRGQYPASIRFLADKWQWGEQKVRSFLLRLKKEKMITTDKSQGMNVITLCKYDEYNCKNTANNTTNNTDISLLIKELKELKTQLITQQITQQQHGGNTNSNKENNNIFSPYAYAREDVPVSLEECKRYLLKDTAWMETICMNNYITPQKHAEMLNLFFQKLEDEKVYNKSQRDAIHHYANWLKIELQKDKNERGNKRIDDATARESRIIQKFISPGSPGESQPPDSMLW